MDMYSTNAMLPTLRSLLRPKMGLLDLWFGLQQTEESEDIHFDVEVKGRAIAPFVSPNSVGKVIDRQGFQTKTFRPAYVKVLTPIRPNAYLKRAMGEKIGIGDLTAQQRKEAILASTMLDHVEQVDRRLNLMAVEALISGQVTVEGEDYPTTTVNFGRDSDLSVVLSGTARWSEDGATPIDDIEAAIQLVGELEGVDVPVIVMDPQAAKAFRRNKQVQEILDIRRASGDPTAQLAGLGLATPPNGLTLLGSFGSFVVFVYADYYQDAAGVTHPVLPAGTVLGGSPAIEGTRAFGAIQDEEAGVQALPLFMKSWVEKNPGVRYLLTQSAPLVVPRRPNASFSIKVFG